MNRTTGQMAEYDGEPRGARATPSIKCPGQVMLMERLCDALALFESRPRSWRVPW